MAKQCYAPVFKGTRNIFACIFLRIIYAMVILLILVGTLFLCLLCASCRCTIKQYQYRMAHCMEGNSNPELPI